MSFPIFPPSQNLSCLKSSFFQVNSVGIGCSIGMLFIMLLLVFISIIVFNWEMTKPMGGVMMVLYLVFVIISLGLSECWIICPF